MTERVRWTDERLDDLARKVERLDGIPERISVIEQRLGMIGEDARSCRQSIEDVKSDMHRREREQRQERKSDRRFLIATVLTAAGLIVAAISLLAGLL